jgi:predicted ATPase/class 3 adenylate cyclase
MTNPPPTGTVTFLFTDIEGSTRLAQTHRATWEELRKRHHRILESAVEGENGYIFNISGDAFCIAFHTATDALNTAVRSQAALNREDWGDSPIRVRMGIHTGRAEVQPAGDYQGYLAMSRVQRLMSAASGGQVLITLATQQLVREDLPEKVTLRDMGERCLKDMVQPEHVFQLVISNLPVDFPPIKTLDAYRHNLPVQLTSFIGRKKEIAGITQAIREHRLVTLTGVGGTGKTRLALQVAADLVGQFDDGVWFAGLGQVSDPELVPRTILSMIGINEQQGRTALQTLLDFLREKNILIVLDNCEHLIEATARLTEDLLNQAHSLKILATSREALGVKGEVIRQVLSLSLPDIKHLPTVEQLSQYEAVALFVERAMLVQPDFAITDKNSSSIVQICARLDGIPLAIELAASRVKALSVDQIAPRLDDRFRLLTGGAHTALPRQQTLRATLDWSYNLLSDPERSLLRRLTIFSGGWVLEAAEAVCQSEGISSSDVLDQLIELVNKSLVLVDPDDGTGTRYRLLDTILQYAREKFQETDGVKALRDRHLAYYLDLASRAEEELIGPKMAEWLKRLEAERDNLRAALEWSLGQDVPAGLRLANSLLWFWDGSGTLWEGSNWLSKLLGRPEAQTATLERARALGVQGYLLGWSGLEKEASLILEESRALCRELEDRQGFAFSTLLLGHQMIANPLKGQQLVAESLALYQELDDPFGTAWAYTYLGGCLGVRVSPAEVARATLEKGLAICRERQYLACSVHILGHLGGLALNQMDYPAARAWLEDSLAIQRHLGKGGSAIMALSLLGELAYAEGDYSQARAYTEESLSLAEETANHSFTTGAPVLLGFIALREGDMKQAREIFFRSQQRFLKAGKRNVVVYALEGLTSLAVLQGKPEQAAAVYAWADSMHQILGDTREAYNQSWVDRDLAVIHSRLDEAAFVQAQSVGRALTMEQAIQYALEATAM